MYIKKGGPPAPLDSRHLKYLIVVLFGYSIPERMDIVGDAALGVPQIYVV